MPASRARVFKEMEQGHPRILCVRTCPVEDIASVLPTFVFAVTLFYALFNPLHPFSRDYIELGFLFLLGEIPYLLLLWFTGDGLAGKRWQSIVLGLAAGGFAGGLFYVTGAEFVAILVLIQMVSRLQREATADPRLAGAVYGSGGSRLWPMVPLALYFLSLVANVLAVKLLALGASHSVIAVLKADGVNFALGGPDSLWAPAVYFLCMTFWELYTLPCARLARFLEAGEPVKPKIHTG